MALTAFKIGKLKIAAHVREELDRAGIKGGTTSGKSDSALKFVRVVSAFAANQLGDEKLPIAVPDTGWLIREQKRGSWIDSLGRGLTLDTSVSIVHHMVNYKERQLDRTFAALVDRTRRAILARLEREDSASVTELAKPSAIKLPAVMKHLDVLDEAGLITRSKAGRTVTVRLRPEPMREAMDWLRRYERFWWKSLDRLAACAESKEA